MAPLIRWNSTPKCTTLPCPQRSNPLRQRSLLPPLQMRHTTVNLMMMVTSRGTKRAGYPEQSGGAEISQHSQWMIAQQQERLLFVKHKPYFVLTPFFDMVHPPKYTNPDQG